MSHVDNSHTLDNSNRSISGTFFRDQYARFKEPFELPTSELVTLLQTAHAPRKASLRFIKLALFGDLKSKDGSLRWDNNVTAITGVEGDYDAEVISFDEAARTVTRWGVEAILYTSPSHTEQKPRWRILAPLSREYPTEDRVRFLARINGIFNGTLSVESFTLSQSYYLGYVGNGKTQPASHQVRHIPGTCIDLIDMLDGGAVGKRGGGHKADPDDETGERFDLEAAFTEMASGGAFHSTLRSAVASMAGQSTPRPVCEKIVNTLFEQAVKARPDLRKRRKEIREIISWVYEKEEGKQVWPQPETAPAPTKSAPANAPTLPADISIDDFYAYLPKHWYLYVPTQTLWPPATIGARLGKVGTLKAARWLDRERAVSQMIWAPGEPQIVKDKHLIEGGWIDKPGAIVFNQFRSPKIEGGDPAQAEPWISLVKYLWPTPMEHEHIIRVLAHKIQHPEIKINHALVLGGSMRIGKDTVLVPIKRILGEWNCTEAKPTTIMSAFNGYMRSLLLMINEARDLGEVKRHEFYLHMKDVIATPPQTVLVNEKHEKAIHVANVCLVIMTTNHRTDGIYLPPNDGRHFPVWSERTREDYGEPDYFDRFYDWLNKDGTAHIAAFLHSLDVSDFRPGRPPEKTDLFHEIVAASRPLETSWIEDILARWAADEPNTPLVFVLQSLINKATDQQVKEWLANPGNRKSIPYRLEDCGYTRIPRPGSRDGRWRVAQIEQNVYGPRDLPHEERVELAQALARGKQGAP